MTDNSIAASVWPSKRVQKAFWWLFFLGMFSWGFVRGPLFPDDTFYESDHTLLASHVRCNDEECADVADRWRDKKTGQIYSRREVDARWSVILFAYGLIGCFAFGYFRRQEADHAFFKYFGMAVCLNLAVALYGFFMHF